MNPLPAYCSIQDTRTHFSHLYTSAEQSFASKGIQTKQHSVKQVLNFCVQHASLILKAGTWLKIIVKSGISAISLHCEQSLFCSKICEQMRVSAVCEYASGKGASSELYKQSSTSKKSSFCSYWRLHNQLLAASPLKYSHCDQTGFRSLTQEGLLAVYSQWCRQKAERGQWCGLINFQLKIRAR